MTNSLADDMPAADLLPVHPRTGLRAVGIVGGRPVWPILGGAPVPGEDDETDDVDDVDNGEGAGDGDDSGDGEPDGADQLGDKGKAALDAMKAKWKGSRDALKPWAELARQYGAKTPQELAAKLAGQKPAAGADNDRGEPVDVEQIRREAAADATRVANERILRAEVRAAAAGKLADPSDALRLLDLTSLEVDDDGAVDADEVAEAIDNLIKSKPYLAAQGGSKWKGSADGGHRKGGPPKRPTSITDALNRAQS